MRTRYIVVLLAAALTTAVHGQLQIPGLSPEAAGTDGVLSHTNWNASLLVDLAEAADTGGAGQPLRWNDPSPNPGKGIYDREKWAVVYKYESVTLNVNQQNGQGIRFRNHPSGAPVIWLVSGDVDIVSGYLYVNGGNAAGCSGFAAAGPGGFRGGVGGQGGTAPVSGLGPGGGNYTIDPVTGFGGGSYATDGLTFPRTLPPAPQYGNAGGLPLIGGSGGAGSGGCEGGGAGGGALLIVAQGTIRLNGVIVADGGNAAQWGAGGSGGLVRLIANRVEGAGAMYARGGWSRDSLGTGGSGRIAIFCNENALSSVGDPAYEVFQPIVGPAPLWPDSAAPRVRPSRLIIDGTPLLLPDDPRASFAFPFADAQFDTFEPVELHVEAENVPLDWAMLVRVVPVHGSSVSVALTPLPGGTVEASTWTAQLVLPRGFGAFQVRAFDAGAKGRAARPPGADDRP